MAGAIKAIARVVSSTLSADMRHSMQQNIDRQIGNLRGKKKHRNEPS